MFCHACLIWLPLSLLSLFLYECFCHAGSVLTGVSSSGLVAMTIFRVPSLKE